MLAGVTGGPQEEASEDPKCLPEPFPMPYCSDTSFHAITCEDLVSLFTQTYTIILSVSHVSRSQDCYSRQGISLLVATYQR